MADLSARLPTEVNSQQRFVGAAPATPSIWESIANFGSGVIQVASTAIHSMQDTAANKHKQEDVAAQNTTARTVLDQQTVINGVDPNATPDQAAAQAQAKKDGNTMLKHQAAADQGTIDPGAAQARMLATARQLFAKFPGHEAVIYQQLKEMGVHDMITQSYKNAEAALEDDQKNQRSNMNKLVDSAINKWGFTDYYTRDKDQQSQILASVGLAELKETQLDQQTKQAELLLKQVDLTDKQRTQLQTQTSTTLATSFSSYMTSAFANVNKMMINMLADSTLANDPGRMEKLQSHLTAVAIPALDQAFNLKIAPLLPTMTPADRESVTSLYKSQKQSLIDMISGPQSIVQQNQRILQNLTDTYGIDYAKSAPTLMRLQKLIGPQALGVLVSPSITGNKPLMDMLANELKGVIADPSKTPSFTEFVQTLSGSTDMSAFDPEKIRAMAPAQLSATASLAKDTVATNGTDKDAHKALVNSIKNTSGIAADVVPAWGFKNVLTQAKVLNSAGVTRSLFNTKANVQEQTDAIRSWIPANTRTYAALARTNSEDKYYKPVLDPHTLTWKAQWNGEKVIAEGAVDRGAFSLVSAASPGTYARPTIQPKPSTAVLEQVATLNHSLNNLADAASKGYDDTFNGKSIPYPEARKYFATGEIPQSLQKDSKDKSGKTPEQNVDDAISHMLDFVNKLPTEAPAPTKGNLPSAIDKPTMDSYYSTGAGKKNASLYQKYAPEVAQAATAHGIPVDIAMNLVHTESKFNPKADSGKAHGLGQISYDTAKHLGIDLHAITPEQNLDHAMAILAENYKATGNWHDAVSMYFSGRPLAKAAHASDGNTTTLSYVGAVVPSSIDPQNLAKYGYVRY
jgi:hypothetical protein